MLVSGDAGLLKGRRQQRRTRPTGIRGLGGESERGSSGRSRYLVGGRGCVSGEQCSAAGQRSWTD